MRAGETGAIPIPGYNAVLRLGVEGTRGWWLDYYPAHDYPRVDPAAPTMGLRCGACGRRVFEYPSGMCCSAGHGGAEEPAAPVGVVITGTRKAERARTQRVWREIDNIRTVEQDACQWYVGDCPTGVDAAARAHLDSQEIAYRCHEAEWDAFDRLAGPVRNAEMVSEAAHIHEQVILLAFPEAVSRGTLSCVCIGLLFGAHVQVFCDAPAAWMRTVAQELTRYDLAERISPGPRFAIGRPMGRE